MLAAARLSAAIVILDHALAGRPLDPAITNWGRANRFAGSGDRAAIRDLVFDAWRCRRSFGALGGGDTGRGLMLGYLRASSQDVSAFFTGIGHAPAAVTRADDPGQTTELAALDCPDWLEARLQRSLGENFTEILQAMQHRAPVFLRVNLAKTTREAAQAKLALDGIETAPHPLAKSSLKVLNRTRKILISSCFIEGLVEPQDAASQAIVEDIGLMDGQSVLDYCAGGGGKSLAMAAQAKVRLWAHDANSARLRDLPDRARRAGAAVAVITDPKQHAPYDLVLVDAPCSGSGSWRRDPQGKWALTAQSLQQLIELQASILDQAAPLVAQNGRLAYATCSLLADENQDQIAQFLIRCPDWHQVFSRSLSPLDGGDGFFLSILTRK